MIRTRETKYHKGSRVEIVGLFPSFHEYERVEIRFADNGATTWINTCYLTESRPGEIREAINRLKKKEGIRTTV